MREQAVVLRQVTDASSLGAQMDTALGVEPLLAGERDPAGPRALEPGDRLQQRGLSRARWPDQRDCLGTGPQGRAKLERPAREGDIDVKEVHERISSLDASRIAAATIMSSTPIAIAWPRLASNRA